jgi:hypothetical protein
MRHPFYRIYSTWNYLFAEGNAEGRELLRLYSNFVPLKRVTENVNRRMLISFKTFVKEVLEEQDVWFSKVPSLLPQVNACDVCGRNWTFITKLETWADDFEVL